MTIMTNLIKLDFRVIMRNKFLLILLIILFVSLLAVHLTPDSLDSKEPWYFLDGTADGSFAPLALDAGWEKKRLAGDSEALSKLLKNKRQAMGIEVLGQSGAYKVMVHAYGNLTPSEMGRVKARINPLLEGDSGFPEYSVEKASLRPLLLSETLIPVLLTFEVLILGFLFIAVMVFQEKQEGTIRAYRISPGGTWRYLASKTLLWVVMTLAYGALFLLGAFQFSIPWGRILALLGISAAFMTLFGLLVAVFFRNISQWFFAGVTILVVNMIPQAFFSEPSLAPGFVRWIPSFPVLLGFRELLFSPSSRVYWPVGLWYLGILALVFIPLTYWGVHQKLMKEA